MTDRILTPIIAIGLAMLAWLYTRSRDHEMLDRYTIPVEIAVAGSQADMYELEVTGPTSVPVSFSGPPSRIRELRHMLQRDDVRIQRTVTVPEERLSDARYVDVLRIDSVDVPVPPGVQAIVPENQSRVSVTLRRVIEKRLPVRLHHTAGDRIEQVTLEPTTVLVRGPKEVLDREESLPTQLHTVPAAAAATEPLAVEQLEKVPLIQQVEGRAIRVMPAEVSVRFTLKPRQKMHELADVPVHFLCPADFAYRPHFPSERAGKVTIKVIGPAVEERPSVAAYVDLTARNFGPGLHAEEPIRVQLPPGCQLAQEPPRLASFQLVPLEAPTKPAGTAFSQ